MPGCLGFPKEKKFDEVQINTMQNPFILARKGLYFLVKRIGLFQNGNN